MNLTQGAIVCVHAAQRKRTIKRAVRDEPISDEDSGWQFHCGEGNHSDPSCAQLWRLDEVLVMDPDLKDILDEPYGSSFEKSVDGRWVKK